MPYLSQKVAHNRVVGPSILPSLALNRLIRAEAAFGLMPMRGAISLGIVVSEECSGTESAPVKAAPPKRHEFSAMDNLEDPTRVGNSLNEAGQSKRVFHYVAAREGRRTGGPESVLLLLCGERFEIRRARATEVSHANGILRARGTRNPSDDCPPESGATSQEA
jgi:hypothetical protein